ncbi:hypothetical protein C7999DRAFT_43802 [Corynascus novoguineensis]|uniref:Uncharacterized protein n=1 Tax=Corynascus novoguineensis TaxID=1126955 RepID=A0AAN7CLX8_9PEZI|nr:hypothetical protein C7999DRAFT_43802 [Corynascus novoguineensis]
MAFAQTRPVALLETGQGTPVSSELVTRRSLSRSVAEFFSKLRPSNRPERGGTARPTTEDSEAHQPVEYNSPALSGRGGRKRPSSLSRHGPDTIPSSLWNMPVTPPRRARSRRRTLISSGDFLGVTGVNPYTGEPDVITPPTGSDDTIVTTTSTSSVQQTGGTYLERQQELELSSFVLVPRDFRRLLGHNTAQQVPGGWWIRELHDLGWTEPRDGSRLHKLDGPSKRSDFTAKVHPREIFHRWGWVLQSVCTRTTTTTGFVHNQPRHRIAAHPCDAMPGRWHEAPPNLRALVLKAHSRSTSPPFLTTTLKNNSSTRPASPASTQLSVWRSPNKSDPPMTAAMPEEGRRDRALGSRSLLLPLVPEPDSDTTSSSTDREMTALTQENQDVVSAHQPATGDKERPSRRRDRGMRKTMRNMPPAPGRFHLSDETDTGKSSGTYTRISTYHSTRQPPQSWQNEGEAFARGAARTAFAHHEETTMTMRTPISAPVTSPRRRQGKAAEAKAKGADDLGRAAKTNEVRPEKGEESQKRTEKVEGRTKKKSNMSTPEVSCWGRNGMMMLVKVVSAYWQVVNPVFDGDSEIRKRFDESRATRGDVVVTASLGVVSRSMPGLLSFSVS